MICAHCPGTCTEYYNASVTQNDFFATALNVYKTRLNDGTIHQKCGTPKPNGSCETLCLDLNFNVVECPRGKDGQLMESEEWKGDD